MLCSPAQRTLSVASMLAPFSTRHVTASAWPLLTARWSGVSPSCAQANQAGGNYTQRCAAQLTTVSLASMLAPFSTRHCTASTWPS
jgi:hypothetical protein